MSGSASQMNEPQVELESPKISRDEHRSCEHSRTTLTDVKRCDTFSDIKKVTGLRELKDLVKGSLTGVIREKISGVSGLKALGLKKLFLDHQEKQFSSYLSRKFTMDNPHNILYCNLQGSAQGQRELDNAQAPMVVEEEEVTPTSKKVCGNGIPSLPQSPQRASSPSVALASIPEGPSEEASTNQVEELEDPLRMLYNALNIKVYDLVDFLLFKYQMKAFTTKAEMLESIGREYDQYFSLIFSEASECMKLVFGIDMIEMDPFVHSYILVIALGITYDGMLTDVQGMPKTGILIVVLGVIFMQGNCVSEDIIWEMLNNIGLYGGRDAYIHQDPRKLISEEFVQEGYLEYRQVPDSDPPSYQFLWGPRAFAETTKMSVLKFFASITKTDPRTYTEKYAEALRDEIERAQAWIAQQIAL